MTNFDKQYLECVNKIMNLGYDKETRSGMVRSIFGLNMRINLRRGIPLLTLRKVPYKGVIKELLWYISGCTNIKPLIEQNVNVWNDDAYRFYKEIINKNNELLDDDLKIKLYDKEGFLEHCKVEDFIILGHGESKITYTYGDLGPVYGKQWRSFGFNGIDQIKNVIDTLKNNPDDRRMLVVAFNPDQLKDMALPPCHSFFQFYTRELSLIERKDAYYKKFGCKEHVITEDMLNKACIPTRELSSMLYCRSQDFLLGTCWNCLCYGVLTHIMAQVCNMTVGDLVYNGGDCHIYHNQFDGCQELLKREGSDIEPQLIINTDNTDINNFKIEDFSIKDYHPNDVIHFPLSVG